MAWLPALIQSLRLVVIRTILATAPLQQLLVLLHANEMPAHSGCRTTVSGLQSVLGCWAHNHAKIAGSAASALSARGLSVVVAEPLLQHTPLLPWAPSDTPDELISEASQPRQANCVLLQALLEHLHRCETPATAREPMPFFDDTMSLMQFERCDDSDEEEEQDVHAAASVAQAIVQFATNNPQAAQTVQEPSLQQRLRSCFS